jgi:alkaline phosphatase D
MTMRPPVLRRARRAVQLLIAAALVPAVAPAADAAKQLALGPMLGHTTDTTATVWLATTDPQPIEVRLRATDGSVVSGQGETAEQVEIAAKTPRRIAVGTVTVAGLKPRTAYSGQVLIAGQPLLQLLTFSTFPAPDQPTHLRIALASGASVPSDRSQWVWQSIADTHPDVMLFLGDNNHLMPGTPNDWEDPGRMAFRHAELRGLASLQLLLRSSACYAIWDDHDYGPAGADKTFALKGDALRLFKAFWANPSYGAKGEGIYSTFRFGRVQLFLLDDRYWRDPDEAPAGSGKTMLGAAQKAWLKRELKASTARIKLIANGGQMLGSYTAFESFDKYPQERDELLAFLEAERIPGVVFVSGDRHLAELQKLERPGAYPLYDFTTSPVAAAMAGAAVKEVNPIRIAGYAKGCNFGVLEIDEAANPQSLSFRLNDDKGLMQFTHTIKLDELAYPSKP